MAQRTITDTLCDRCLTDGRQVVGETLPAVSVGKAQPRFLDLCIECKVEVYDPLVKLVQAQGRTTRDGGQVVPMETTRIELEDFTCEDCSRQFANEPGLKRHRTRKHSANGKATSR